MKIFLDSAEISEVKEINSLHILDGVTTNPTLIKKSGRNYFDVISDICMEVSGPVSAEVVSHDSESMVKEGLKLAEIASNVVIKIPFTKNGLLASSRLIKLGKRVNMTLCFSALQAMVAAKIGVHFISPFVGRLDDITVNGMNLISAIYKIYKNYGFHTEIIVASVRNVGHVMDSSLIGAHIVTVSAGIVHEMLKHPLTENGLEIFTADWEKTRQKIT